VKLAGHTKATAFSPSIGFPLCAKRGELPIFTWALDKRDLGPLEALLAAAEDEELVEVADEAIAATMRDRLDVPDPAIVVTAIERALEAARTSGVVPSVPLDRDNPTVRAALDIADGDEATARALVAHEEVREVIDWTRARLPVASLGTLARAARACVSTGIASGEPLRYAAIEAIVEHELAADEAREREALERPAVEAAARLTRRAADIRAQLASELAL
jgi:hypothetical protein